MYRTGDLGKYDEGGLLVYVSRKDFQIKHMGHRIELGEIESAAMESEEVSRACCIYDHDKSKLLLFYTGTLEKDALSALLAEKLPPFMHPNVSMRVNEMPMTKNGKLDKKSLPDIDIPAGDVRKGPTTNVEKLIAHLFCEVLGIESIGIDDSFFEMGGHSLKATKLINRIEAETGKNIPRSIQA